MKSDNRQNHDLNRFMIHIFPSLMPQLLWCYYWYCSACNAPFWCSVSDCFVVHVIPLNSSCSISRTTWFLLTYETDQSGWLHM